MSIVNIRPLPITLLLAGSAWLAAYLCFWLLPTVFETWDAQTVDQLFVLRDSSERLRPPYDGTVVHVDLDNSTIQGMKTFYLERAHFAQAVRTLAAMGVAAQAYDFIFAAPLKNVEEDQAFIDATQKAGNVYFGLAMTLGNKGRTSRQQPSRAEDKRYVEQTAWSLAVQGDLGVLYVGTDPVSTFSDLAIAARGLGYLSSTADRDGILRRLPLVVRYNGAFYPSLAFRVICDYLHVPPANILVTPGRQIILRGAQRPGAGSPHDIVIPIDRYGNMIINYIGAWERFKHYSLGRILSAAERPIERKILQEDLSGKIVMIADVSTGTSDVGAVPLDANFPLGGLHTNVMNTILTENFLRELSAPEMLFIEAVLLSAILVLALRYSSLTFAVGTLGLVVGYVSIGVLGFLYGHVIANFVRPLLMLIFATVTTVMHRVIQEERAKQRLATKILEFHILWDRLSLLLSALVQERDQENQLEERIRVDFLIAQREEERQQVELQLQDLGESLRSMQTSNVASPSLPAKPIRPMEIFYSYAHEDEVLRNKLSNHLSVLQRNNFISTWHDRAIRAGMEWESHIDEHLESADIILLLVSADFIASDYCWGKELKRAMERHETDAARVSRWREIKYQYIGALGSVAAIQNGRSKRLSWKF